MIAKIRMKRTQTIVTLVMEGNEDSKALTISFIPWFLEIILKGLNALKALKAFTDWRLDETEDYAISSCWSSVSACVLIVTTKSIIDAITTMKSTMFQGFRMYGVKPLSLRILLLNKNPMAMILIKDSMVKESVKQLSM